jgi:ferredoxin--NADP+ reductase
MNPVRNTNKTNMKNKISNRVNYGLIYAIGPVPMMRKVCEISRPYKIKTIVSLNPVMVDGTGMCGSCRVSVGDETRFACVHGPEFDGHLVDFDELEARQELFKEAEQRVIGLCTR